MTTVDLRDRWPKTLVMVGLLIVMTVDVTSVPAFSAIWFRLMYLLAAVGLLAWRITYRHAGLVMFGSMLATACGARAILLCLDGDRWSGAAINALMTLFVFGFVRNRHGVEPNRSLHERLDRRSTR